MWPFSDIFLMNEMKCSLILGFFSRVRLRDDSLLIVCALLSSRRHLGDLNGSGATQLPDLYFLSSCFIILMKVIFSIESAGLYPFQFGEIYRSQAHLL